MVPRKTVFNQRSKFDLINEDTPTKDHFASSVEAQPKTVLYSEVPMPSGHKKKGQQQEDMFISAFYDNEEFIKEDKSEGFSSNASSELNFHTSPNEPSPEKD